MRIVTRIALATVVGFMVWNSVPADAGQADVTIASGTLHHHRMTNSLFHVDGLWMQVESGTEFHRWLLPGVGGRIDIILTRQPERFGDDRSARILSGTLLHTTSPDGSGLIHQFYLRDQALGTTGPITFQTKLLDRALRFDGYDGVKVSLVMLLTPSERPHR